MNNLERSYFELLRRTETLEKDLEKHFPFKEDEADHVQNVLAAYQVVERLEKQLLALVFFNFEPKNGEKQKTLQRIESKISKMPKLIAIRINTRSSDGGITTISAE